MKVIKCDRCGEICSIGRGVTFTHNNGSTADLCPDCYDKFNLWLKQKEPKPETTEQSEKRMTCREWMVKHFPQHVCLKYGGNYIHNHPAGCVGCPKDHLELWKTERACDGSPFGGTPELCEKCWSQPVPEGVEQCSS